MRAAHCDRARLWISLQLDGVLSDFETAMRDQHVGRCADCRAFKVDAAEQTVLLREASLERVTIPVELPARPRPLRHALTGLGTVAAAAAAAVLSLHLAAGPHSAPTATHAGAVARPAALAVLVVDAKTLGVRQEAQHGP